LIQLQAAIFLTPAVVSLYRDLGLLADLRGGLAVRYPNFNLPQLKQMGEENARLKRIVADLTLDKAMLQDVLRKKF